MITKRGMLTKSQRIINRGMFFEHHSNSNDYKERYVQQNHKEL